MPPEQGKYEKIPKKSGNLDMSIRLLARRDRRGADLSCPQAGVLRIFLLREWVHMSQNDSDVVPAPRGQPAK